MRCEETSAKKTFHFANGQSSDGRLAVWCLPIFVGGIKGQIYSAEMPDGTTPLLLSIPAMEALDMILYMRKREAKIGAFGLRVPLVTTRTKHLAMEVAYREDEQLQPQRSGGAPQVYSEIGDLIVYYTEEARLPLLCQDPPFQLSFASGLGENTQGRPSFGPRGVSPADHRGQLSERRAGELLRSWRKQRAQERRGSVALQQEFSIAEQWATDGFQNTFVFEPFSTQPSITKFASSSFAWTCSSPLPRTAGGESCRELVRRTLAEHKPYLLVIAAGDRIWKDGGHEQRTELLLEICGKQQAAGRYYLLEGLDLMHHKLLKELVDNHGAQFAFGDRCRYGAKAGVRGRTKWVTNSQVLLNSLCRQCACPFGTHRGNTSRAASSQPDVPEWTKGLCQAVCRGIQESMVMDYAYAAAMSFHEGRRPDAKAYPAEGQDTDEEMTEDHDVDFEEPAEDDWQVTDDDRLIRIHNAPRRRLFVPLSSTAPPCDFARIGSRRVTRMLLQDGTRREHQDDWEVASWNHRTIEMDFLWTGQTEFELSPGGATEEALPQHPPQPRDPRKTPDGLGSVPFDSAVPYDSAVMEDPDLQDYEPSPLEEPQALEPEAGADGLPEARGQSAAEEAPQHQPQPRDPRVLRRRQRTRHLQRGFWTEVNHEETIDVLEATLEHVQQVGGGHWVKINVDSDLGITWKALESAEADVRLILASTTARRLKKPQPHLGPAEVPLRRSYVLMSGHEALSTDFEQWAGLSPAAQVRPIAAQGRLLYVAIFGTELGAEQGEPEGDDGDRGRRREEQRDRKWQALPRELKLAINHVNLGHASMPAMLRALRIARASETAVKACRLFRCPECPRLLEPKRPRPSKLPITDEFNVMIVMDVFQEKDAQGQGIMTDRAKYFLADVAEEMAGHGCYVEPASKAAPWQLGQVERHGDIWKSTSRKIVWSDQVAGREEILLATAATTQAKNAMSRKGRYQAAGQSGR